MKKLRSITRLIIACFFVGIAAIAPYSASAATPTGYLDLADNTVIAGWARDSDWSGPVRIHIYVKDTSNPSAPLNFFDYTLANLYRSDVGNAAFQYVHPPFGPGVHVVSV